MPRRLVLAALLVLIAPSTAVADVCVAVDEPHDALGPQDRLAARTLLERQLIAAGASPCTERWTVSHILLGGALSVTLEGPRGTRTATVATVAELGVAYATMIDELLAPGAPGADTAAPQPAPGPPTPRAPVIRRRGTFLGRVGYGVRFSTDDQLEGVHGTTFGIAYRRSTERFGFEVSALNMLLYRHDRDNDVLFDSFVRLGGFAYVPSARRGAWVGLAFSYGDSKLRLPPDGQSYGSTWTECGPQAELSLGTELLSSSVFQVDVMLNALLPLYAVEIRRNDGTEYVWSPGVSAALSVGF